MCKYICAVLGCSVVSNSSQPHGLQPSRLLCLCGFSRQEYWSGLPCPSPGDLPNPGIEPKSPTLQGHSLPAEPQKTPEIPKVLEALGRDRGEDYVYLCWSATQLCLILQPHGLQHTSLPCPSVCPGVCSNSCPLSQ